MGRGGVVRLGDRWDARGGVELGDPFRVSAAALTKVPGQRSAREGPRPTRSQAGAQKAGSLIKAEGRAAGARAGTGSCLRLRDKLTASFGDPVRPPKLL